MAKVNTNNAFLSFNGIDVSGLWTDTIDKESSANTEEATSGSNSTHVERVVGLLDNTMTFVLIVDDALWSTYRSVLVEGALGDVIYGPEGNATGKPKFACSMIVESVSGPGQTIQKGLHKYEVSCTGAAAPTATPAGGDEFA